MEQRRWEEYTVEEKKSIVIQWWYYFGRVLVMSEETEEFERLLEMDVDLIFKSALLFEMQGYTTEPFVAAMKNNRLIELLNWLLLFVNREGYKRVYPLRSAEFIGKVLESFDKPKELVSLRDEVEGRAALGEWSGIIRM